MATGEWSAASEGERERGDRGIRPTMTTVVTGVEMFKKLLDEGTAGDNVGCCCGAWSGRTLSAGR